MRIVKDKLQKGQCFPLRSSTLEAALLTAGVKTAATLYQNSGAFWQRLVLFSATFSPPGQLIDNQEDVLWISCRTVDGDVCREARGSLEHDIIPAFIAWVTHIEAQPRNSPTRREKQNFERAWQPRRELPSPGRISNRSRS